MTKMTKMTKMTPTPTYRILELQTTGWEQVHEETHLTKEQCDQKLKELTGDGLAPDRIKVERLS